MNSWKEEVTIVRGCFGSGDGDGDGDGDANPQLDPVQDTGEAEDALPAVTADTDGDVLM